MLSDLMLRLRALFRRETVDSEIDDELRFHLERQVQSYERAGLSHADAVRRARLAFGGLDQIKEEYRDALGVRLIDDLRRDFRIAVRSLRATPVVTVVAILSLALTIGANTAIFSILNALILRTLPVHEPARLVHLTDSVQTDAGATRVRAWSYPVFARIRQTPEVFGDTTAWSFVRFNLASGGEVQPVEGLWADGAFFATFGVAAAIGRTFSDLDDQPGGGADGPVAVISHGYWQRQFGGAADVVGRSVHLNTVAFTIIGVTPPEFFGPEVGRRFDVIVPVRTEALVAGSDSVLDSASTNFLYLIARLRPGQSPEAAAAEFRRVQPAIREATMEAGSNYQDRFLTSPFTVLPAATSYSNLRRAYQRPLVIIAVIVTLVLLVGCVNIANLLLARAIARRHEMSMRLALGASRWRLGRQLLAESLTLAGAGAALGVIIAAYGSDLLVRQLSTSTNLVFLDVSMDGRVLAFTIVVALLTALLFGTAPALRAARTQPMDALKRQGRASGDDTHGRLMGWLVVGQVALSVVLVAAAGLFIRSFVSLTSRPLGLQPSQVLVVTIDAQRAPVAADERVPLFERTRDAVVGLPNVAAASISFLTPAGGGGFTPSVAISPMTQGQQGSALVVPPDESVSGNLVSPGWFATFGTPLIEGRDFTRNDRVGAPRAAIVNETFARRFLQGGRALGRNITVYPGTPMAFEMTVVGVVADAIYSSPRDPVPPTWYLPIAQFDLPGFPLVRARLSVRAKAGSPVLLTKSLETAIAGVNPQLALTFRSLDDQLHASLARERLMAQLAGFLGGVALLLAGLGLYGVTAYAISRRRAEIGIRLALGAAPCGVVRLVLARVSLLVGGGIAVGSAVSLWAWQFVDGLLYGLPPRDPATLLGAAFVLTAIGALAGWLPARRAGRIDPAAVLRES